MQGAVRRCGAYSGSRDPSAMARARAARVSAARAHTCCSCSARLRPAHPKGPTFVRTRRGPWHLNEKDVPVL